MIRLLTNFDETRYEYTFKNISRYSHSIWTSKVNREAVLVEK